MIFCRLISESIWRLPQMSKINSSKATKRSRLKRRWDTTSGCDDAKQGINPFRIGAIKDENGFECPWLTNLLVFRLENWFGQLFRKHFSNNFPIRSEALPFPRRLLLDRWSFFAIQCHLILSSSPFFYSLSITGSCLSKEDKIVQQKGLFLFDLRIPDCTLFFFSCAEEWKWRSNTACRPIWTVCVF